MFVLIGLLALAGSGSPVCADIIIVGPPPPTPPNITITQPTANESESNSVFIATGTVSSDYGGQAVYYSLNGSGWKTAVLDGGGNWMATLNPSPGPNRFQAYVVDNSGETTVIPPVTFQYIVTAPLTVYVAGAGAVFPNYSNVPLQIGEVYVLTATPAAKSGYTFAYWTGGATLPLTRLTGLAAVRFTMVSNLVLQANFTGPNLPAIGLTSRSVSGGNFVAAGTNEEVTEILGQLNGGGWSAGTVNTNNRTWIWATPQINLIPGTNVLQFCAQSASGAFSPTLATNLVLQANFTGSNLPAIGLTNRSVSGGNFVAAGTNEEVTVILGQLNGGRWSAGTVNTNNRTWIWATPQTNLIPGANVLQFCAQSASGAFSPTLKTSFFLAVPAMLTVMTNGSGVLTPQYNGQLLFVGNSYTVTARPAKGFEFAGWSGGTNLPLGPLANQPTVRFTMVSNLMLAANFVKSGQRALTVARPANGLHLFNSGSQSKAFNFTISGSTNGNVVVEACENLAQPHWIPVSTNTLANGLLLFSDLQSSNHPTRYYRVRSQ